MRVSSRLQLILLVLIVSFVGALTFVWYGQRRNVDLVLETRAQEVERWSDRIVDLVGRSLYTFSYDYTYWTEMVDFVSRTDPQWASDNIEASLATYSAQAAWVFKPDFTPVYFITELESDSFRDRLLEESAKDALFAETSFTHFFIQTDLGPMEIRGATIHPSEDLDRETDPQGYFFVGRLWGEEYLAELAALLGCSVAIRPPDAAGSPPHRVSRKGSTLTFHRTLYSWDNKPLARLDIRSDSPLVDQSVSEANHLLLLASLLSLCLLLVFSELLVRWVAVPLKKIASSLDAGDAEPIWGLRKSATEFGHIAQLITQYFRQKQALESEILERQRAETQLQESSHFLEALLESIPNPVFYKDTEGRYLGCNKAFETILGRPRESIIGKRINDVAPQDVADQYTAVDAELLRTRGVLTHEGTMVHADGSRRDVVFAKATFNKADGSMGGLIGAAMDITDRKRMESALRESEQRFRDVVMSSADWLWETDVEGHYTFCSGRVLDVLGYMPEEVIGKTPFDLMDPVEAARVRAIVAPPMAEGRAIEDVENTNRRKDGTAVVLLTNGVPIRDVDGRLVGYRGVDKDITEWKRAEVALRKAKEAAEEAARAKAMFLANMSHEIRTPMNGVIGMNNLLLETELTAEQRQYAEAIGHSAEALLSVINDILDFSKLEAGRMMLECLDFDLRATIEDMNDVLAIGPQKNGVEYACIIAPEVPALLQGDPGRLRQVLTNLISNAVKFTAEGEIVVRADLVNENEREATIRLAVSDTGIGIPGEKVDSLFRAFCQLDASVARKYGGTGLGLAISKQIVEMMGGEIGVDSEPDKGSTFWFTVTFRKQAQPRPARAEMCPSLEGAHILIVDDNATNRFILREQLASWTCRHEEAASAESAIAKLRDAAQASDPFAIAILDMQMPEVDGETLGQWIRQDEALADTRLVMLTSVAERGDVARLEALGFCAYLTKPIRQSRLYDCLVSVLSGPPRPAETDRPPIVTQHSVLADRKRRVRILLAEDNRTNQMVAMKTLEKLGYCADVAADGLEAVRALQATSYDVVFMDVQMPKMDGFEATKFIRDPNSPVSDHNVPIIAMTAHAMKGDREKCLEAGMDDYVSKPIKARELEEALDRQLRRQGTRRLAARVHRGEPDTTAFDKASTLARLDADEALLREVLAVFVQDAQCQIEALKRQVARGDAERVRRQAHTLKGAAGNAGAVALEALARELETLGLRGDLSPAEELVAMIEVEFERFRSAARPQ